MVMTRGSGMAKLQILYRNSGGSWEKSVNKFWTGPVEAVAVVVTRTLDLSVVFDAMAAHLAEDHSLEFSRSICIYSAK
jgi:hypothetical protein